MLWVMMYSALNCGRALVLSHQSRMSSISQGSRISACGPSWPSASGPGIARAVAPGADVELVERIGARRLLVVTRSWPATLPSAPDQLCCSSWMKPNGEFSTAIMPATLGTRCEIMNTIGPPVEWPVR